MVDRTLLFRSRLNGGISRKQEAFAVGPRAWQTPAARHKPSSMPDIVLLSGSPSASSKSVVILEYAIQLLTEQGLTSALLNVRDFPAQDLILAKYDSPAFDSAKQLIAECAGLIVATPVYKAAYSGGLKAFLDILPQYAFRGKTLLPIANGGSPGHQLAIDYALKPVLSAMAATDLLQGVYVVDAQFNTDADGKQTFNDEIRDRLRTAVSHLAANVKSRSSRETSSRAIITKAAELRHSVSPRRKDACSLRA
jgi:FMN reductase